MNLVAEKVCRKWTGGHSSANRIVSIQPGDRMNFSLSLGRPIFSLADAAGTLSLVNIRMEDRAHNASNGG